MKKTEILVYTAGIIDGEGSIYIRTITAGHKDTALAVFVTNTEEWLCQWLKMQYGGTVHIMNVGKKEHWKTGYRWWITSNKALEFLKLVLPYLNLKRPQAELAINYQENRKLKGRRNPTEEEKAVAEAQRILMKNLNKKGI